MWEIHKFGSVRDIKQSRKVVKMSTRQTKNVSKLIRTSESMTVEWKPSLSQINEIIRSLTAFANTEGGTLFVGVSKDGKPIGISIGKDTIEDLTNRIAQHTEPKIHPRITVIKLKDKEIIVIDVKESHDKLVLADGKPYVRVGKSTRQMTKDEYEHRILEKHRDKLQFDETVCKSALLKDIDAGKVSWFLDKAKEEKRLVVPARTTMKDALVRLNLLRKGKPINTAILLFGKDPQKFFVQAKIRVARFKGTQGHDYLDMKVLEGTIPELREKALAFIAEHTRHAVFFDANQRFDKWEYPFRALEEVLNNALAHRDYWSNADIHLAIYDDRIEIWNPGELPKQLTPAMLKRKHLSIPRNRFLAERLFYIKYIEHWGRGTNRMVEDMRKENLSDPIFEELSGGLNVTLIGPGKAFEKVIEDQKLHKLDLNDRQRKAIEYLSRKGEISRKEYVEISGVSPRQANKDLNDLLKKKVVIQVGRGRSTKYRVHD
ncbi:MAG: putative DNA binding domain-containing protein [Deltaproteobacteria bacterium]|nr:putative DNA binding domain-containing protein [Deltaproteobacteria bacterium]